MEHRQEEGACIDVTNSVKLDELQPEEKFEEE